MEILGTAGATGADPGDDALLARIPPSERAANGVPDPEEASARERAVELAEEAIGPLLLPGGVRTSPLGPGWSGDLDLHVRSLPDSDELERRGWARLDPLLGGLGWPGEGAWAIVEGGRVLAKADLHLEAPPGRLDVIVARCERRGEVRAREVLELRALVEEGLGIPVGPVAAAAARVEAWLGGTLLDPWRDGPPARPPARFGRSWMRRWAARLAERWRPRPAVAVSGVDGSGKTALVQALEENLARAGIPVTRIWTRPGMRLSKLEWVARMGKRAARQPPGTGVERIGGGEDPGSLPSRRGVMGWTWVVLVTLAFLRDVRRQRRRGRGLLLYERHLLDALATVETLYEGGGVRFSRFLIRRFMPRAGLTVYLDVDAQAAFVRKAADLFREEALRRQLDVYRQHVGEVPNLVRLDGTRPRDDLAAEAFGLIARLGG